MTRVRIIIIGVIFVLLAAPGTFAQQAIIQEIAGTVEIQLPGSAVWESAVQGQSITGDTFISTGFRSYAIISIGNSSINLRPLTRLSIAELSTRSGTETINVGLQAGRIRADVHPPAGTRTSFVVVTPPATASVRGTVFEVEIYSLKVMEGAVEYTGVSGNAVLIDAGGNSYIDEQTGRAAPPMETLLSDLNPQLPLGSVILKSYEGAAAQVRDFDIISVINFK